MTLQLSMPRMRVTTITGEPAQGWQLFFYESGSSSVAKTTFNDAAKNAPNPNPVLSDASGWFPEVVLDGSYNVVLRDDEDNLIWSVDPVTDVETIIADAIGSQVTPAAVRNQLYSFFVGGGSADEITVTITPSPSSYQNGMRIQVRGFSGVNASTEPVINVNTLGNKKIVRGNNEPLAIGDLSGGDQIADLVFSTAIDAFVLMNPRREIGHWVGSITGGNAISLSLPKDIIHDGLTVRGIIETANTGPVTVSLNSGSPAPLKTDMDDPLEEGDLYAGQLVSITWISGDGVWVIGDSVNSAVLSRKRLTDFAKRDESQPYLNGIGNIHKITSGSGNWTVPDGVYRFKVTLTGGGATGAGDHSPTSRNGEDTTFSGFVAEGGVGPSGSVGPGSGGGFSGVGSNDIGIHGGDGHAGGDQDGTGGSSFFGGGGESEGRAYGSGGGGARTNDDPTTRGGGGGAGGTVIAVIETTPGSTFAYSVGQGGAGFGVGVDEAKAGADGIILIEH